MNGIIMPLLFFILFINCAATKRNAVNINDNDFKAVTLSRDTVNCFSEKYKKTFLVFYNNYSCLQCFVEIGNFLKNNSIDTSFIEVVVIGRVGTASLSRRNAIRQVKELIPSVNRVVFDIHKEEDGYPPINVKDGIFGQFKVEKTPALIIWNNAKGEAELFLKYRELMEKEGKMSNSVKENINKLIRP